ncbi:hypothetical protein CCACVL1_04538 [Corchorus capsularis]|uniref:Chromo domain-containing protein n=1 Tax=Corchorus capsularis TaxID=210143 RepID=A0A1R3JRL1_COCAP|nr:hypothetical protein CCACVL1_04538 [Corchorus capsularis]
MVLNTRKVKVHREFRTQWLIKWKQLPTSEATWEWATDITKDYPEFNMEDKVVTEEGANVMNPLAARL